MKDGLLINPFSLIASGIVCVIIAYNVAYVFLKVIALSLIVAAPFGSLPIVIIGCIGTYKEEKLEKVFLNFLLQIKNYTKLNNDIVSAFSEVQTVEPLQKYIKKFNLEIGSGTKFEKAIEHLKEKITTHKFREFFSNVQHCYLYGGNFSELIDKSYKMIDELQKEKAKRMQETKSARIVLVILMLINIYIYMAYIKNNYDNYLIMQKSFFGNLILYWNFISMWLLILLASKVKKLDY